MMVASGVSNFDCIYEQSVNPLEIACNADVHMVKSGLNEMLPCDTLSPSLAKRTMYSK